MKFFRWSFLLLIFVASCKSSKQVIRSENFSKMSARKVSKKHTATLLDKQTIEAKLKVAYEDSRVRKRMSVKLKIVKDRVIWLNITYAGFLVARAKITPEKVSYYEKINKTFFEGNFTVLRNFLGSEVNFYQLQNLLLGQAIFDLKTQSYKSVIDNNAYLLEPSKQQALFTVLFWINPKHFKLDKQEIISRKKNQLFQAQYKNYTVVEGEMFPKRIELRAKQNKKYTHIVIEYRSVIFDKNVKTPYKVPRGYRRIIFK